MIHEKNDEVESDYQPIQKTIKENKESYLKRGVAFLNKSNGEWKKNKKPEIVWITDYSSRVKDAEFSLEIKSDCWLRLKEKEEIFECENQIRF